MTLTLTSGTGALGGTLNGTITNGTSSVTISGITYTKAESGVVLTPVGGGLGSLDSPPFTVVPGDPVKLSFGVQPSAASPGEAINPAVTVLVQDAYGNTVTSDASGVTIGSSSTDFASGSTATFTVGDKVLSGYQALVAAGNISRNSLGTNATWYLVKMAAQR